MGRAFGVLSELDNSIVPDIRTSPEGIVDLLRSLEQRVATLVRRCLSKHEWLDEYNKANPATPEPYHLVCISHYPTGFESVITNPDSQTPLKQDEAGRILARLLSHENAAKAGIYFLITTDQRHQLQVGFMDDFICLGRDEFDIPFITDYKGIDTSPSGAESFLDTLIDDSLPPEVDNFISLINARAKRGPSTIVRLVIPEEQWWTSDASNGLEIPVGRAGAKTVQFILGGESIVHNALIGGAVGTGKTVILHNIIAQAAQLYSPEELQMLLLDYKEGTEFAVYRPLPHVRVLSIASEVSFGLKVFEWLRDEVARRSTDFKKAGVSSLADYRKKTGLKMARLLVVVDEFQRLLADRRVGAEVTRLLDDVTRRGRSFGLNLVLSTQSLGGADIQQSTLSQIGLRICLRLSETDAAKFLNFDNTVPTSFKRPGQAVYNSEEGHRAGNHEFQVAYFDATALGSLCQTLRQKEFASFGNPVIGRPVHFIGDEPAVISLSTPPPVDALLHAWLGETIDLEARPIGLTFGLADGANLLILANDTKLLRHVGANLIAQFLTGFPEITIAISDALADCSTYWKNQSGVELLATTSALQAIVDKWCDRLNNFSSKEEAEVDPLIPHVLFLLEPVSSRAFPNFANGDISPLGQQIERLLREGPRFNIHLVVACSKISRTHKLFSFTDHSFVQLFGSRIVFNTNEGYQAIGENFEFSTNRYSGMFYEEQNSELVKPFRLYQELSPKNKTN
jgi:hypothetical protein